MADSHDELLPFLQRAYERALAARQTAKTDLDQTMLDGPKERNPVLRETGHRGGRDDRSAGVIPGSEQQESVASRMDFAMRVGRACGRDVRGDVKKLHLSALRRSFQEASLA
jgi:hypothetical protein